MHDLLRQRPDRPAASMCDRRGTAGAMPPRYVSTTDAVYAVVEGEVTFYVGSTVVSAGPGSIVEVGAGVPRTYRVATASARWLVAGDAAAPDAFGRALAIPSLDRNWPGAEEEAAVATVAALAGLEILGPPGALP